MNGAPRVVFINPWDRRIGPNRYLADMLAADPTLARNAVVVLPTEGAAADEYRALGCAVEIWEWATLVHIQRSRANLARVLQTHTRGVQFARQRLRALRPDAVMTNSENVWFGGMAARTLGIPHLQVFHALTLEHHWGGRPYLIHSYLRWLGLWAMRFVAVSHAVAEMLVRNGIAPERVATVPNGLNLEAIRAASGQPLPPEVAACIGQHSPVLVTLGRVSALKGHDLLVETLARVRERFPNVVWLVGGAVLAAEGVEDTDAFFTQLQARVAEYDLKDNLVWLNEIDYAPALLRHADVYVQPSRSESFCRAVVEALACGAPVATFRAGALPEVAGPGGLIVPAEDVDALAAAIVRICTEPELRARLLAAGQQHIRMFEVQASVAALHRVLDQVLKK